MGLYAEFYLINLRHLSERIGKIKQIQATKNPEQLDQLLLQLISEKEHEEEIIKKRLRSKRRAAAVAATTKEKSKSKDSTFKTLKEYNIVDDDGVIHDWKFLSKDLVPSFHVSTLNSRAFDMFYEFGEELGLDECWSNEEEFEEFVNYHSYFKKDLQKEFERKYRKKDGNGDYVDLSKEESERLKVLFTEEVYYQLLSIAIDNNSKDDMSFTFIHPCRLRELSEHFKHSTQVPRELLIKSYQKQYDEYLNTPEKKKVKTDKEQTKMSIQDFISDQLEIDTFDEILKHYNSPKYVFSLIDRPVMDPPGPVPRICHEELHNDYWISIIEFIGDPFTLARLGMTCSKLQTLFQQQKDVLFNSKSLKKDIGLFTYIG